MSKQKQKNKKSKRKGQVVSETANIDIPSAPRCYFTYLLSLLWAFLFHVMEYILFWRKFGTYCPICTIVLIFRPKSPQPDQSTKYVSSSILTDFCRSNSQGPCNKSDAATPSSRPISNPLHSQKSDTPVPSIPSFEDRCTRLTEDLKEYVDTKLTEFEKSLKEKSKPLRDLATHIMKRKMEDQVYLTMSQKLGVEDLNSWLSFRELVDRYTETRDDLHPMTPSDLNHLRERTEGKPGDIHRNEWDELAVFSALSSY